MSKNRISKNSWKFSDKKQTTKQTTKQRKALREFKYSYRADRAE